MDPNEVEFLGEKEIITIVPNFNFGQIHLSSGSVGPFRAGLPVNVPIWLAINFKQQQKCRIICPEWMHLDNLISIKENEKSSKVFTAMPSDHYMDEAHMILNIAAEDITDIDSIRTAIKDIWDIRMSKLRTSINELFKDQSGVHVILNHLTPMEIANIRPLLPHAMDQLLRIKMCDKRTRAPQSQDSQ